MKALLLLAVVAAASWTVSATSTLHVRQGKLPGVGCPRSERGGVVPPRRASSLLSRLACAVGVRPF
jgi:hypothetical protein